jgi:hypothetical protein
MCNIRGGTQDANKNCALFNDLFPQASPRVALRRLVRTPPLSGPFLAFPPASHHGPRWVASVVLEHSEAAFSSSFQLLYSTPQPARSRNGTRDVLGGDGPSPEGAAARQVRHGHEPQAFHIPRATSLVCRTPSSYGRFTHDGGDAEYQWG